MNYLEVMLMCNSVLEEELLVKRMKAEVELLLMREYQHLEYAIK